MAEYASTAAVTRLDFGRMAYHVLPLDPDVAADLPFDEHPRLRISGEIGETPIDGAWTPDGTGGHYLILSKKFLKASGTALGDVVTVRFALADPDAVDVPGELAERLSADEAFREGWEALTPGRRRGLAYRVASAKRAATRSRRVKEIIAAVLNTQ